MQKYPIDSTRIVTAGMSQGSGMAIHIALYGRIPVRGFMSIAVGWSNFEELASLAPHAGAIRGYFVIGERDHTLQSAREIQKILRDNKLPFAEEIYPDLGHEFPPDFEKTFDKATGFIFKEHE